MAMKAHRDWGEETKGITESPGWRTQHLVHWKPMDVGGGPTWTQLAEDYHEPSITTLLNR